MASLLQFHPYEGAGGGGGGGQRRKGGGARQPDEQQLQQAQQRRQAVNRRYQQKLNGRFEELRQLLQLPANADKDTLLQTAALRLGGLDTQATAPSDGRLHEAVIDDASEPLLRPVAQLWPLQDDERVWSQQPLLLPHGAQDTWPQPQAREQHERQDAWSQQSVQEQVPQPVQKQQQRTIPPMPNINYKAAFLHLSLPASILSLEAFPLDCNDAMVAFFQMPQEKLFAASIVDKSSPEEAPRLQQLLFSMLADHSRVNRRQHRLNSCLAYAISRASFRRSANVQVDYITNNDAAADTSLDEGEGSDRAPLISTILNVCDVLMELTLVRDHGGVPLHFQQIIFVR